MKIIIHIIPKEPEDYTPFSMVFGSVWKAYDGGELSPEKLLLLLVLYRRVNPFNGMGQISYVEICILLRRSPTKQNINTINKLMMDLREAKFIWFPGHSGSREFPYVIAKFKLAKNPGNDSDRWVDIEPYFQSKDQSKSRANERTIPSPSPEPVPRQPPPEQRLERSNGEGITSIGDFLRKREIRPPQTDTES